MAIKLRVRSFVTAVAAAICLTAPAYVSAQQYSYDAAGRVQTVVYPNGWTTTYTYDKAGNRVTESTVAPSGAVVCTGTFTSIAANRGLEVRSGRPGAADWEFGLGFNTQMAGKFVAGQTEWVSGQWVPFSLTIDAQGNASVTYGTPSVTLTYSASLAGAIGLGNAVKFYVKASGTTPASSVALRIDRVNTTTNMNRSIATLPTATTANDATLVLKSTDLTAGAQISGSIQLNFSGTVPSGSRLGVLVLPGNCS